MVGCATVLLHPTELEYLDIASESEKIQNKLKIIFANADKYSIIKV